MVKEHRNYHHLHHQARKWYYRQIFVQALLEAVLLEAVLLVPEVEFAVRQTVDLVAVSAVVATYTDSSAGYQSFLGKKRLWLPTSILML
jgi:hypothetical protein